MCGNRSSRRDQPEQWGEKGGLRTQRGLYANGQGEIFDIAVAGEDSDGGEKAIRAYSEAMRVCLDQIFTAEVGEEIAKDVVEMPVDRPRRNKQRR